jgi:hypothetical protein
LKMCDVNMGSIPAKENIFKLFCKPEMEEVNSTLLEVTIFYWLLRFSYFVMLTCKILFVSDLLIEKEVGC